MSESRAEEGKIFPFSQVLLPPVLMPGGVAALVARILTRACRGNRHATKHLARQVGRSPRTVRNWMNAASAIGGDDLVEIMRANAELADAIFRLVEEGRCPEE